MDPKAEAGGLELRPTQTIRQIAEAQYFHELVDMDLVPPIVGPQQEPGRTGRDQVALQTNIFGIGFENAVPIYRYDVSCVGRLRNDRPVDFTKKSADDAQALNRSTKCRRMLKMVIDKNPDFFGQQKESYWYDLQHILFTKNLLNIPNGQRKEFVLEEAEIRAEQEIFDGFRCALLTVTPCSESFVITLGEITRFVSADLTLMDHSLQQFLEILTSQYALNNPDQAVCYGSGTSYLMHPNQHGFSQSDCPPLGDGKYLGIGCAKSVRFIEGPKGRGNEKAALVVDLKKTAFHADTTLLQKVMMMLNKNEPAFDHRDISRCRSLKGLTVETTYGRPRRFGIDGFSRESASQIKFTKEGGQQINLVDYFKEAYNLTILPNIPVMTLKARGRVCHYPLELLNVVDGQRVTDAQQTPKQLQTMIRSCAVPPADRMRQIGALMRGMLLTSENIYHRAAGIAITKKPLQITGRLLSNPKIVYGEGKVTVPDKDKATWRTDRNKPPYLKPATISKWTMAVIKGNNRGDIIDQNTLTQFATLFVGECHSRGMSVSGPTVPPFFINAKTEELEKAMQAAKESNLHFFFFITNNDVCDMHHHMKMLERKLEIRTQDLRMSSAADVVHKNKRQTLENIVNKTNMKNGGLNYTLDIAGPVGKDILPRNRLIVGLSVCHSKGSIGDSIGPSVLGVAANVKEDPLDFVGDCLFQPKNRDERIGIMQPLLRTLINQFEENRGIQPTEIIVYRNGGSEGQYRDILELELLMLRTVANGLCGKDVKVTMIISQKMHNIRLMPSNVNPNLRAPDQNIRPGTVVDSQIIHPAYNEFYLNSHVALQGSARTPRYTVLHDDLNMTLDELETLTYNLSFAHQIVNLTTSLPSPIYIASAYAERGNNLYGNLGKTAPGSAVNAPNGFRAATPSATMTPPVEGEINFNKLMAELSYANSDTFRNLRINA